MWQFHTINTAFLSCSENMWMQKKKKKKRPTRFNDKPDYVTHPLCHIYQLPNTGGKYRTKYIFLRMATTICTIQASLTSAKESWMLSAPHWRFTPSYTKQITCNIKLLQKESKSGEREYSIQYHIQLQDRLHNLHYIHTTIFILQYTQEKTGIKSNSSAIFEKIEVLFSLTKNEI